MDNTTLTAITGLTVGHAQDVAARTGCTVIVGPFRGAAFVAGFATGTRELDVLDPAHLAPTIDALLLTGGSAFGLAAADGVVRWLAEQGRGFQTPVARVPIVPAAVIFDLATGSATRRPDAAMAHAACQAATGNPVAEGAVGAGTGATVGKLLGPHRASPGGIGSWATRVAGFNVAALAVVNALGDVLASDGRILAGARLADGRFADAFQLLRTGIESPLAAARPIEPGSLAGNTSLAVIATDAPLSRLDLHSLARQGSSALARRIAPVFTPFDGDIVFALSSATEAREHDAFLRLQLAAAAQFVLETAIERAVMLAADQAAERNTAL